jgi:8-oxo-dGTP diphosphatase
MPAMSFARDYPLRPIAGVGAVIYVTPADAARVGVTGAIPERGVVLIRRRFEPLAGQWSLPGGAIEAGETLAAAVAREVMEETGLVVEVGPVIDVLDRIMLDDERRVQYHFVLVDYLCRPSGGRLEQGSDAAAVLLADVDALESFALSEQALAMIRRGVDLATTPSGVE